MRSADQIEQELDIARSDLETSLEQLKDAIHEKVDIKAKAERAMIRAKVRAEEAADRALTKVATLFYRAEARMRARPDIVTGVLLGVVALASVGVYIAFRVRRSHRLLPENC